jgi:hypothetical protein
MRISRLIVVLMIGFLMLSGVSMAKPILDFNNESVYNSRFCKTYGCQFVDTSLDKLTDSIYVNQYLYRLKNSLYFLATRWDPFYDGNRRFNRVTSVSLMTRATTANLKKLEAFLSKFIDESALGYHLDLKYDFKHKCADATRASFSKELIAEVQSQNYRNFGFFETIVLPPSMTEDWSGKASLVWGHESLVIACVPQPFNMLSVTLFWGHPYEWLGYSIGFNCSSLDHPNYPVCPWAYPKTVPRRIF